MFLRMQFFIFESYEAQKLGTALLAYFKCYIYATSIASASKLSQLHFD